MEKKEVKETIFWSFEKIGNRVSVIIHPEQLIDFCSKVLGFYNYVDYSGNFILVKVSNKTIVEETTEKHLKHAVKDYLRSNTKNEDVYSELAQRNYFTKNTLDLIEKLPATNFNVSSENEAFFFYQNGVVSVSKVQFQLIPYEEYAGSVWKEQINKRNFSLNCSGSHYCDFNRFLINVCGKDVKRYHSLISILGYLLHPYKNPSLTKAVILIDEKIDFSGTANGGSGKSLIAKALEQITSTVFKDGKKYNSNEVFGLDDIRPYTRLLYFDDVKPTFRLDDFFSSITGDLRINRKYRDSIKIPARLSPKILISSNYMVQGTGGETDERRRIEFEVTSHYSMKNTPRDEFGKLFFEDWDEQEWLLFDTLLLKSVKYFMNKGISMPPQINLTENKLKMRTNPEFIIYMDNTIQISTTYDKAELLLEFKALCPDQKNISAIKFRSWIGSWSSSRGYKEDHFKSNGKALFRVENNQ